jgi:hypothetical protein
MPRPRLSPEERKQRRREAALKGIAARAAKREMPAEPPVPTAREILDRARALGIHRERELYRRAHELRIGHRPEHWNPRARLALAAALAIWEAKESRQ